MIAETLGEFKSMLSPSGRLLGLDHGTKTIGMSISDRSRLVATPYQTLKRKRFCQDAQHIESLIDRESIIGVVAGLPISMHGKEGPRCQSVRQFMMNFIRIRDVAVLFWDERLSTAAVERVLIKEADLSRQRRRHVVDKVAAAYILQGALDALRHENVLYATGSRFRKR